MSEQQKPEGQLVEVRTILRTQFIVPEEGDPYVIGFDAQIQCDQEPGEEQAQALVELQLSTALGGFKDGAKLSTNPPGVPDADIAVTCQHTQLRGDGEFEQCLECGAEFPAAR